MVLWLSSESPLPPSPQHLLGFFILIEGTEVRLRCWSLFPGGGGHQDVRTPPFHPIRAHGRSFSLGSLHVLLPSSAPLLPRVCNR